MPAKKSTTKEAKSPRTSIRLAQPYVEKNFYNRMLLCMRSKGLREAQLQHAAIDLYLTTNNF